jgi:hypothetical protein
MVQNEQSTDINVAQPELSISDLVNLRAIIETASKRGAFAASEMTAIGSVFDRLNTFLNAVAPAPASQAPEQETTA